MTLATAKPDSQIKADVIDELTWDACVDENAISVSAHNGVVNLSGHVRSYAQRLAACEAAHRVFGVLDVVDSMSVRASAAHDHTDEKLAAIVRSALQWDALVPDERISTTVSDGVVTLEGSVDSWSQRREAERVVSRLTGIRDVHNRILVAAQPVNPGQLKNDIEYALERQAQREARRIGVTVRDGVVTLTGSIRSWAERNAIERVVGSALGVKRVEDRTSVDPYH